LRGGLRLPQLSPLDSDISHHSHSHGSKNEMGILSLTRAQITALLKKWVKERVREIEKDKDKKELVCTERLKTPGTAELDQRRRQIGNDDSASDEDDIHRPKSRFCPDGITPTQPHLLANASGTKPLRVLQLHRSQ